MRRFGPLVFLLLAAVPSFVTITNDTSCDDATASRTRAAAAAQSPYTHPSSSGASRAAGFSRSKEIR